jgi:hypothetical protein
MRAMIGNLATSVNAISEKLDGISDVISLKGRTDWSTLAAWASVILVLVAMAAWPISERLTEVKIETVKHRDLDSHPVTKAKTEELNKDIGRIERSLLSHVDTGNHVGTFSQVQGIRKDVQFLTERYEDLYQIARKNETMAQRLARIEARMDIPIIDNE